MTYILTIVCYSCILLCLQKDAKGTYETIEMFECAKYNTNDQCKRHHIIIIIIQR